MPVINGSIRLGYDTLSRFTTWNGILLSGQVSIVSNAASDDLRIKIGDGATAWTSLPYYSPSGTAYTAGAGLTLTGSQFSIGSGQVTNTMLAGSIAYSKLSLTGSIVNADIVSLAWSKLTATPTTTGTANRISVSGGGGLTPTIDIDSGYVGQASITTLGTITTGVWSGTSILTSKTDAKIKGSIAASNGIAFGNGTLDTVTDSASLIFNGTSINVGGTSYSQTINGYAQTSATSGYVGLKNSGAATFQGLYFQGATTEGYLVKMNAFAGNHTGTSIPFTQTLYFRNGATSTEPFLLIGIPVYQLAGQTSTNYGTRLDTTGFKVDVLSNLHTSTSGQRAFTVYQDSAYLSIGSITTSATSVGLYAVQTTPSGSNYSLNLSSTNTNLNAPSANLNLQIAANTRYALTTNTHVITSGTTTGSVTNYTWTASNSTGVTSTANIPKVLFTLGSAQWTVGSVTNADLFQITAPTITATSASTFTYANTFLVSQPIQSTNATLTNRTAAILNGSVSIGNSIAPTLGGGDGVLFIANATADPTSNPTSGGILYASGGALKYRTSGATFVFTGTDAAAAPTTNAIGVILDYYGTSATRVLTTPNSWASVVIGGTTYKIPLYT